MSHTETTTVLLDEFDARVFERSSQYSKSRLATIRMPPLKLTDGCEFRCARPLLVPPASNRGDPEPLYIATV